MEIWCWRLAFGLIISLLFYGNRVFAWIRSLRSLPLRGSFKVPVAAQWFSKDKHGRRRITAQPALATARDHD